jgi:hypothetical protein
MNSPSADINRHDIFFTRVHISSPTVHKYRYLANVHLPPPLGPPICLRYALWANAAATSEKYSKHREVFYKRARKYAEIDETKVFLVVQFLLAYAKDLLGPRRSFRDY